MNSLILTEDPAIAELLRATRRIAVLGIKDDSRAEQPGHYVPAYLVAAGLTVYPVPVYDFGVDKILGLPVRRTIAEIPETVDLVDVFRRPQDIAQHLPDLLAAKPRAVWFQLGIRNDPVAEQLAHAGIYVVQDRCLMVEHRRLLI